MNEPCMQPGGDPNTYSFASNTAWFIAGAIFTAVGLMSLVRGEDDLLIWFALGQLFLSLMSFSWPKLKLWQKLLFTPVLLTPAALLIFSILREFT